MIDWTRQHLESEEVIYSVDNQVQIDLPDIDYLIRLASQNSRKRIRLCVHKNPDAQVHEMFIVHPHDAYVRPHLHVNRTESMLILMGEVDHILFDDTGLITSVARMGDFNSGEVFYNSLRQETYHTLLIRSEWLVFLETTKGPFDTNDTVFPLWCPEQSDTSGVGEYMQHIKREIKNGLLHT